jgi:FkbM family methyltransferase
MLDMGFRRDRIIWPKDFDMLFGLYFSHANQSVMKFLRSRSNEELVHVLEENAEKLRLVYDLLTDRKSKDLLMAKLAFLMRSQNMELFRELMMDFSEPISEFGLIPFPDLGPENYFYFNNDVFSLGPDEVFVDVGAFDGDSVTAFVQACRKNELAYEHIYAFEPDPANYAALVKNTHAVKEISYHRLGVWSHSDLLRFQSSGKAFSTTASGIAEWGDIEIEVVSLDHLLGGKVVTLIKMDPPGSIIEKALKGAENTISRYKPRLVLNAYDRLEDIFEVPYLLNSLWPDYKLYLRHVSWTISETDLFALAP